MQPAAASGPAWRPMPRVHAGSMKPSLVACLLLSVALHAGLYALPKGTLRPGDGGPGFSGETRALRVRVEAPQPPPAVVPPAADLLPPVPTENPPPTRATAVPVPRVADPTPLPMKQMHEEISTAIPRVTEDVKPGGGVQYLPRGALTVEPEPEVAIMIPYPREGPPLGRFSTDLALFIDESGAVQRVRFDGPRLPPLLEEVARKTFLAAHWRPGQFQGQAVRSLVRVEVTFESGFSTPVEVVRR